MEYGISVNRNRAKRMAKGRRVEAVIAEGKAPKEFLAKPLDYSLLDASTSSWDLQY